LPDGWPDADAGTKGEWSGTRVHGIGYKCFHRFWSWGVHVCDVVVNDADLLYVFGPRVLPPYDSVPGLLSFKPLRSLGLGTLSAS
jgi:hypothetical protein